MISIHTATAADAESITEVHIASTIAAYGAIVSAEKLTRIDPRDRANRWREVFADGCSATVIAEADGRAVGFINFGPCRNDDLSQESVGEVMAEYVHPEAWRRGIGRRLMQEVLEQLTRDGFHSVVVWTLEANRRAISFYEQVGFARDGSIRHRTMFGTEATIIRLRRDCKAKTV